jgi:MFS family permease
MLSPVVALGFARFAYALFVPAMRANYRLSFTTLGALNAANTIGYFIGALITERVRHWLGTWLTYALSLGITGLSLLGSGITSGTWELMVLRMLAGIAGAIAFIIGATLAVNGSSPSRINAELGIYFAGGGIGIAISGLFIPYLIRHQGPEKGWLVIGVVSVIFAFESAWVARSIRTPEVRYQKRLPLRLRPLSALLASYGLFGLGYIAYMTFSVEYFVTKLGTAFNETVFWVILGCAAVFGASIYRYAIATYGGKASAATIMIVLALASLLPLAASSEVAALASSVLFGGSFLSVVTAVTAAARITIEEHQLTAAIATLTVAFAIGQGIGPLLAGLVATSPAYLSRTLLFSAAALALGAAIVAVSAAKDHFLLAGK